MKVKLKHNGKVIFSDVDARWVTTNSGGYQSIGGSFSVSGGPDIQTGEDYQMHRESGKWAEIRVLNVMEESDFRGTQRLVRFSLIGDWKAPEESS